MNNNGQIIKKLKTGMSDEGPLGGTFFGLDSKAVEDLPEMRNLNVNFNSNSRSSKKHEEPPKFSSFKGKFLKLPTNKSKKGRKNSKKSQSSDEKLSSEECKFGKESKTNKKEDLVRNTDNKKIKKEYQTERESSSNAKVPSTTKSRKKSRSKNFMRDKKEKQLIKMQQEQQKIKEKLDKNKEIYNFLMKHKSKSSTVEESFCTDNACLLANHSASEIESTVNVTNEKNVVKNRKTFIRHHQRDNFQDLSESTIVTGPCNRKNRALALQDKRKKIEQLQKTILEKNKKMFNLPRRLNSEKSKN